jgi:hypothetical protein
MAGPDGDALSGSGGQPDKTEYLLGSSLTFSTTEGETVVIIPRGDSLGRWKVL